MSWYLEYWRQQYVGAKSLMELTELHGISLADHDAAEKLAQERWAEVVREHGHGDAKLVSDPVLTWREPLSSV